MMKKLFLIWKIKGVQHYAFLFLIFIHSFFHHRSINVTLKDMYLDILHIICTNTIEKFLSSSINGEVEGFGPFSTQYINSICSCKKRFLGSIFRMRWNYSSLWEYISSNSDRLFIFAFLIYGLYWIESIYVSTMWTFFFLQNISIIMNA